MKSGTVRGCRQWERTPIPVLGVDAWTDKYLVEQERQVPLLKARSECLQACDSCFMASRCPHFRPRCRPTTPWSSSASWMRRSSMSTEMSPGNSKYFGDKDTGNDVVPETPSRLAEDSARTAATPYEHGTPDMTGPKSGRHVHGDAVLFIVTAPAVWDRSAARRRSCPKMWPRDGTSRPQVGRIRGHARVPLGSASVMLTPGQFCRAGQPTCVPETAVRLPGKSSVRF
jgi:hypothetical protein